MSILYLTAYCEAPTCAAGRGQNCAEIELPEHFGDLGDLPEDVRTWGLAQLESLGWSTAGGEHRCSDCTERQRLKDVSGLNPD